MRFEGLKDTHKGETCLVIGNGPSLAQMPLDFLHRYPSFASNRIYLLDGFNPFYYVCVNPLVLEQSLECIIEYPARAKFVSDWWTHSIPGAYGLVSSGVPSFSRNPAAYIYEGHTVTYVSLQLAYFMGFSTVLLVGVDHSYRYQGQPNQEVVASSSDPNHFHPDYFGPGTHWHNPDLERSARAYAMAKTVYESDGRQIINLTPGSKLDVFRREDWQAW
jgi:hypothetical protein